MPSIPIRWIVARAFCQATEDEDRVAGALNAAVSGGVSTKNRLAGQFGNPVLVLSRRLEAAADVRLTWVRWGQAGLLQAVAADVDARVDDDGILHLRLDKQEAAEGRLSLHRDADAIDIQVKLKAYPAKPEEIHRVARNLFTEAV